MLKRLRTRLSAFLARALLIVPWVVLVALATVLLIDPGVIRDFAISVGDASLLVRLLGIVAMYAAVFGVVYVSNPTLAKRVRSRFGRKQDSKTSSGGTSDVGGSVERARVSEVDERKPRFATDLASRKARFNKDNKEAVEVETPSVPVAETVDDSPESVVTKPETVTESIATPEDSTPKQEEKPMSEDDFYAFLESVSDDSEDPKQS